MSLLPKDVNKYKVSRRGGRKLMVSDDPRTAQALPKDLTERTWLEILQREENEIVCYEIREDIVEDALQELNETYMDNQAALFTVHCAAQAWLRLIDWHFYLHDPGEDPSASPPCFIPRRAESWVPDEPPEPSVKDSWGREELQVLELCPDEPMPLREYVEYDLQVVEPIPEEYWFPGKVNLITDYISLKGERKRHVYTDDSLAESASNNALGGTSSQDRSQHDYRDESRSLISVQLARPCSSEMVQHVTDYDKQDWQDTWLPNVELVPNHDWRWNFVEKLVEPVTESSTPSKICTESEVVQKVTDYGTEDIVSFTQEEISSTKLSEETPSGSMVGAGDSGYPSADNRRPYGARNTSKTGTWGRHSLFMARLHRDAVVSTSHITEISDCRLRNLRLETQYELSSENLAPVIVRNKRK